ncbi:MAG: adenylosuccinate lyase, partial [Oscillospiraceae bacterium]|nr:adenylosuccinate lyase [Oscillospiraceae bacterium]
MNNKYESPLSSRYASDYMLELFSSDTRYQTWRRLWVSLAKAEMTLGLPVTQAQVDELSAHITDIDYECVSRREKEVRHDVMAHIYAYGKAAPTAAGIIHLGATSCYVTDNADLIIYRDALKYLRSELLGVLANLSKFAEKYKDLPTLGYTHYQPAQLVTVGKRAALWMQDFLSDLKEIDFAIENIRFLGCRGTTGTEASFVDLFDGDTKKTDEINRMIAADFGFDECFDVVGQTYPRKVDSRILNALSSLAQSCYRMANDIRLLQHDRQVEEPFEKNQIGSSAMAYKRNPMRSERICSLARYLIADAMNAPMTASVQWLERTLDDSANRRISLPEGFLCADAILRLAQNVTDGLRVNKKVIEKAVKEYLPFIATENLMMEAVKRGGDRQKIHEIIRRCSMEATEKMKDGEECDLLARLAKEKEFGLTEAEMKKLLDPA